MSLKIPRMNKLYQQAHQLSGYPSPQQRIEDQSCQWFYTEIKRGKCCDPLRDSPSVIGNFGANGFSLQQQLDCPCHVCIANHAENWPLDPSSRK